MFPHERERLQILEDDLMFCGEKKEEKKDESTFQTTGKDILFGVTIGESLFVRVKNNQNELAVKFQGLVDDIALFTSSGSGTGLLRIALDDITTARIH